MRDGAATGLCNRHARREYGSLPSGIGVEHILGQNRVGEFTPSVEVVSDGATTVRLEKLCLATKPAAVC